jgi:hypothetical protein
MLSAHTPLVLALEFDPAALGEWAVPVIGLVATGLAFAVGFAVLQRRTGRAVRPPAGVQPEPAAGTETNPDPFLQGSRSERRAANRRGGSLVAVSVTDADAKGPPVDGWVSDRSVGGLCLLLEAPVGVGTLLNVRPRQSSAVVPWTQVEVKSCRQEPEGWEIGCQFLRTPPWSVLLLFG